MDFNLDCYRHIFNNLNDVVIITDVNNKIIEANNAALQVYSYSKEEFSNLSFGDLLFDRERDNFLFHLGIDNEINEQIIFHKDKDNNNFPVTYSKSEILIEGNDYIVYNIKKTDNYLHLSNEIANYLETYKIIFDNSRDVIYTITPTGIISSINGAIENITKWKPEEMIYKHFTSFIHPEDLNFAVEIHHIIQKGMMPDVFEAKFLFKSGDYHNIEFSTVPMKKNNKVIGTIGIARDINDKKRIEQQLRDSEHQYKELVRNLPNLVIVHTDDVIEYVNDNIMSVLGYTADEVIGKDLYSFVYHSDIDMARDRSLERLSGNFIDPYDIKFVSKGGDVKIMEVRASIIKLKNNLATLCVLTDITDRVEYEQNLKEKELQYRNILDSMPDIVFLDVQGEIIFANKAATSVMGIELEDIVGKNIKDFFEEEKLNLRKSILKKKINKKQQEIKELLLKTDEENFKDVEIRNTNIRFNKLRANLTVVTDITQKKRIEREVLKIYDNLDFRVNERTKDMLLMVIELENEIKRRINVETALRASEHRLKKVLETGPLLMYAVDKKGLIQLLEGNSLKSIGLNPRDYIDQSIFDIFKKNKENTNAVARAIKGDDVHTIIEISKMVYEAWYCPMFDNNEKIIGATCVALDITERIEAEEKIMLSLKEKEVLLKEIHHRVKNNLQIIHSLLNLQSNCISDSRTIDLLMNAKNRVRSMVLIHEKLYQSKNLASIKFNEYIKELSHDLINSYSGSVGSLALNLELEPIEIDIDIAIPCGLILNELITNSLKYAFKGKEEHEKKISIKFFKDKNNLNLIIADNGIGLPQNIDVEKTNTLGMQLVTSLSNQINGNYKFKNAKPSGTEFYLKFKNENNNN